MHGGSRVGLVLVLLPPSRVFCTHSISMHKISRDLTSHVNIESFIGQLAR